MILLPSCKCCGGGGGDCASGGHGWRCYEQQQDACCLKVQQGSGFAYAQRVIDGEIPPNDSSGLSYSFTGDPANLAPGLTTNSAASGECVAADGFFGFSIDDTTGYGAVNVYLHSLADGPVMIAGGGESLQNNQTISYATWIKSVSFGGVTVSGGDGCLGVSFFPSSRCNIPDEPDPIQVPNDFPRTRLHEVILPAGFTGEVVVEWHYQHRQRTSNTLPFDVILEKTGTVTYQWDELMEMKACLPCGVDPTNPVQRKCFDAPPPIDDGWQSPGDCHDTEAECNADCVDGNPLP